MVYIFHNSLGRHLYSWLLGEVMLQLWTWLSKQSVTTPWHG